MLDDADKHKDGNVCVCVNEIAAAAQISKDAVKRVMASYDIDGKGTLGYVGVSNDAQAQKTYDSDRRSRLIASMLSLKLCYLCVLCHIYTTTFQCDHLHDDCKTVLFRAALLFHTIILENPFSLIRCAMLHSDA